MATSIAFSSSVTGQAVLSRRTAKLTPHNVPTSRSHKLQDADINITPQFNYTKGSVRRKSVKSYAIRPTISMFDTNSLSPAQTIMQFYTAINEKNVKQLDKFIAEECFFQDYTFPEPFQGKKEVLHFLERLTMCMGEDQNMQFNIEHICEGNDYTAAVNWHLDWKKIQVPFTRGCSYYSLSVNGDKLVIKKAQVHVESPIKLGVVALFWCRAGSEVVLEDGQPMNVIQRGLNLQFNCTLAESTIFKIVSSLFDAFPAATEWFLKCPDITFQLLLKAYNIVLRPIISPVLAWYIKLLNFAAFFFSFTLRLLYYLAKMFHT